MALIEQATSRNDITSGTSHNQSTLEYRRSGLSGTNSGENEFTNLEHSDEMSSAGEDVDENGLIEKESPAAGVDAAVDGTAAFLEELEEFAAYFKSKRIQLGFTQGDVGLAMGKLYGNDFSQTTVSRFEALNLSFKNMCKLKPVLEKWLQDTEAAVEKGTLNRETLRSQSTPLQASCLEIATKRRKKRTSIESNLRQVLEEVFLTNPRPSAETLLAITSTLNMSREVVRVWFCNRRQKERRQNPDVVYPSEQPGAVERFKAAALASGLTTPSRTRPMTCQNRTASTTPTASEPSSSSPCPSSSPAVPTSLQMMQHMAQGLKSANSETDPTGLSKQAIDKSKSQSNFGSMDPVEDDSNDSYDSTIGNRLSIDVDFCEESDDLELEDT